MLRLLLTGTHLTHAWLLRRDHKMTSLDPQCGDEPGASCRWRLEAEGGSAAGEGGRLELCVQRRDRRRPCAGAPGDIVLYANPSSAQ